MKKPYSKPVIKEISKKKFVKILNSPPTWLELDAEKHLTEKQVEYYQNLYVSSFLKG